MKKWSLILYLVTGFLSSEQFTDPITGLSLETPPEFVLDEEGSQQATEEGKWWYQYVDVDHNCISIEIEGYDRAKSLPEHFHHSMTEEEGKERIVFEGLEFRNLVIEGREFTKSKLRILAISDQIIEPICLCDYLFVEGQYGFIISLTTKKGCLSGRAEQMMESILKSIRFE